MINGNFFSNVVNMTKSVLFLQRFVSVKFRKIWQRYDNQRYDQYDIQRYDNHTSVKIIIINILWSLIVYNVKKRCFVHNVREQNDKYTKYGRWPTSSRRQS